MITEKELESLSYPDAPKIATDKIPGEKGRKIWDEAGQYETPTRVGGICFPFVWNEAYGSTIRDPDGNVFIDMTGGLGTNNTGHAHPKVVKVIREQSQKLMHTLDMVNPCRTELAKKLSEIMPRGLRGDCFTCFATSGSGAVDIAVKYAKMITGRTEVLGFQGAYAGVYGASLALTASYRYRKGYKPFIPEVYHLPYGYCYRCFAGLKYPECGIACAKYAGDVMNTPCTGITEPACVVVEPIQGEGGYVEPPKEFYPLIREACTKAGALLIVDEVQSGFGRSGKMWAIEHWGVEPDMLIWGKGVGGDQPIAGVTVKAEYRERLRSGSQPATFPGNALSCAAALANISIMTDQEDELIARAEAFGAEIKTKLMKAALTSPVIGEVRGRGFMLACELVRNKKTREPIGPEKAAAVMLAMRDRGVLSFTCGRYGNVFRFMPPLTTPRSYFEKAVDIWLDILKEDESDLIS